MTKDNMPQPRPQQEAYTYHRELELYDTSSRKSEVLASLGRIAEVVCGCSITLTIYTYLMM